MSSWNVVVSVYDKEFVSACKLMEGFGKVRRTNFTNLFVMEVGDINIFLETLKHRVEEAPSALTILSKVIPVTHTFTFRSPEEFEEKAREIALKWIPQLAGKRFHVRMHRRGFKGRLSSQDEEHFLDDALLDALEKNGHPGKIIFENPDAIVVVETIGSWAGMSCWNSNELRRYPFIKLD